MTTLLSRIWRRITGTARRLYQVIAPGVRSEVLDFINDPSVQSTAIEAVEEVRSRGLRDHEALDAARAVFRGLAGALATGVATHLIDVVIHLALAAVRHRLQQPDD